MTLVFIDVCIVSTFDSIVSSLSLCISCSVRSFSTISQRVLLCCLFALLVTDEQQPLDALDLACVNGSLLLVVMITFLLYFVNFGFLVSSITS